jgi:dihydrodipicolinate synthase/N-acetylneuraminate lyase
MRGPTQTERPTCRTVAARLRPGRAIDGIVAALMPWRADGRPDLDGLAQQLERITALGLRPAVNMDTGYAGALTAEQRTAVLSLARRTLRGRPFVAGAYLEGGRGPLEDRYRAAMDEIEAAGGTPILFPCTDLRALAEPAVVALHGRITEGRQGVLLFELGEMFVPFGRIYSLAAFTELMMLPGVAGLKHSSLERGLEWARLAVRDQRRPRFRVYTGNDLAIDMVMWGSDYLLGLAAFHPEAFAARDRLWAADDARFFALNDALQALGAFAFRRPVPAYRHDAALYLRLRGLIDGDDPPPGAPRRPDADREILAELRARIDALVADAEAR